MRKAQKSINRFFSIFKTQKTRMAVQAQSEFREVGRLGQNLIVMEISN